MATTAERSIVLLLDTHVWFWLVDGSPRLPEAALAAIDGAAARGELLVSVVSVWEISMLEAKGRVRFDTTCLAWVEQALAPPVRLAPLTPEIAVESTRLPGSFHPNPADRLLTATARVEGAFLMTRDRRIVAYAREGHVRTVPV